MPGQLHKLNGTAGSDHIHRRSLLLDEEDALDRQSGVGVDHEGRVLKMRGEEGKDGEKLLLRELWEG